MSDVKEPARSRQAVVIGLPRTQDAPGFRSALVDGAGFSIDIDEDRRTATVYPTSPGELLSAHRLLGPGESHDRIWQAFADHPKREIKTKFAALAKEEIARLVQSRTPEGTLSALSLFFQITSNSQIRTELEPELDAIQSSFPDATLWMMSADDRLLSRNSLVGILFQQVLTPDLDLGDPKGSRQRSLRSQSTTSGVSWAEAVQPIFLAFTPAATGFAFAWVPHALMLEFGSVIDLRTQQPTNMGALYQPRNLSSEAKGPDDTRGRWINDVPKTAFASLLAWWVACLNQTFGIATDVTRFPAPDGTHDPAAHLAHLLTIERVLADMRLLGASPQASALERLGVAFDLLDKLETLLGYGPTGKGRPKRLGSGRGFERLLNRDDTLPVLKRSFGEMPLQVQRIFSNRTQELFDEVYDELSDGVLQSRLRPTGVLVGTSEQRTLPWSEYAGQIVRSIRNSSHGLLDQVKGRGLDVAVTHTGALPKQLPELVLMIAFGVMGTPEKVWEQDFWANPEVR